MVLSEDFRFHHLPQGLVDIVTTSVSESVRKIRSEWEWDLEAKSSLPADLVAALGWMVYQDSAGTQETPTLRPRPTSVTSRSQSESVSPVLPSDSQSSFYVTSSQLIHDTREEALASEAAVQGEAQVESLLHTFLRLCVRTLYRYHPATKFTIQVDPHHSYYRLGDLRCTNDGGLGWLVKDEANGGIHAVHFPSMAALEAKAKNIGTPPQHAAELLAVVLERVAYYTPEDSTMAQVAASMPSWMLVGHGVLLMGTDIVFTKLELTAPYVAWLLEGSGDFSEMVKLSSTQPLDLMNEQQRISAAVTAVSLISKLHSDWLEEVRKGSTGERNGLAKLRRS